MTRAIPASTLLQATTTTKADTARLPTAAEWNNLRHSIMQGGCFPQRPQPLPLPLPQHGGCFPRPSDQWDHCGPKPFPPQHGGCWSPLDLGALQELNKLDQARGPVGADQMADAIQNGTADLDGQAASGEYRAFAEWAQRNGARMTPEARQVMDIYSRYAAQAQARGEQGIPQGEWNKMVAEMKAVKDQSAQSAVSRLDRMPSPISGEDLAGAIRQGVGDRDGQTAAEAKAIRDWAAKNGHKLSPEAKEVLGIFNKHVDHAAKFGHKDLPAGEWNQMLNEFRNVGDVSARKATEKLDKENGPISGEDMLAAIKEGINDNDGNATGSELREFQKWASKNSHRLTPEARKVLQAYEKHAKKAGADGMSTAEFNKMVKEMGQFKTFKDNSMRAALEKLDDKAGKISGKDMANAIKTGAGDFDGKAASTEFADTMKWARQNYARLSPEARQVVDIYERYAAKAKAKGSSGIANADFQRMLKEMDRVGQPVYRPTHIVA